MWPNVCMHVCSAMHVCRVWEKHIGSNWITVTYNYMQLMTFLQCSKCKELQLLTKNRVIRLKRLFSEGSFYMLGRWKDSFIHSHVFIVELMMIVSLYKCIHFTSEIIHKWSNVIQDATWWDCLMIIKNKYLKRRQDF